MYRVKVVHVPPSSFDPHPSIHTRATTNEYKAAMAQISPIVDNHWKNLVPGDPQLNYCDPSVMVGHMTLKHTYSSCVELSGLPSVLYPLCPHKRNTLTHSCTHTELGTTRVCCHQLVSANSEEQQDPLLLATLNLSPQLRST